MALKPKKSRTPSIPIPDVLKMRDLYFKENCSYTTIQEDFKNKYHKEVIRKAIKGVGKYYAGIKDDIPLSVKDKRRPSREIYNHKVFVAKYDAKQWVGNKRMYRSNSFMDHWSEERIEAYKKAEELRMAKIKKEAGWD